MVGIKMGNAYTDAQKVNEGYKSIATHELYQSPYQIDKIKIWEQTHDGSVYIYKSHERHTGSGNKSKLDNYSRGSKYVRLSDINQNIINKIKNRHSELIDHNIGGIFPISSRNSTYSLNKKMPTLHSIQERSNEDNSLHISKKHTFNSSIKRHSEHQTTYNKLSSSFY